MSAPTPQIWLVRHGETAWTLTGQHTGTTDLPLTPHGEDQARALAPRLQELGLAHVWVSPRLRAKQTCRLAGCGRASTVEADLAEWDYGEYEGQRSADIRLLRPGWAVWKDGCPGGENPRQVQARADRLIEKLTQLQGPVAVFSHGHFCTALALRWTGLPMAEGTHFMLHTASLSKLACAPGEPQKRVIEVWDETGVVGKV